MEDPGVRTLNELMAYRARVTPRQTAVVFQDRTCTFQEIWDRAQSFAALLRGRGVDSRDHVILLLPNGLEFIWAFFGTLLAGAVAVPLYPASGPFRVAFIARHCHARAVVVSPQLSQNHFQELEACLAGSEIALFRCPDLIDPHGDVSLPSIDPDQDVLVQYTSGSTGNPKGVRISHDNLLTNMNQLIQGMRITPRDVFVSWLPVYHDMGLILMTLVPIFLAAPLFLLPVQLSNVRLWLDALIKHRGTVTAAPDFAYRLLLRHVEKPEDGSLSALRMALNAAEPVRMETIRQFESRFGLKNVMVPGYGLAEATVGVTTWPPGAPVPVDERGFVSVGPPFQGVEIRIVENGVPQRPGQIGTIAVKSTANTVGYLNNPEETKALFLGDGFLDTGDLGHLDADGNLFITGRRKDIILRAGQTIAPAEIEEVVDRNEHIRFSAAVGIDRGGPEGEQVYVFAELRRPETFTESRLAETVLALVQAVNHRMGFRPGRLYLVKPGTVPRTHNGKLRRLHLKEAHLSGELRNRGDIIFPQY